MRRKLLRYFIYKLHRTKPHKNRKENKSENMATIEDFQKLYVRVGRIIEVEDFPEAKKPAYKVRIDLGSEIGMKHSCAQLTANYSKDDLRGKLVLCVANLPPRRMGPVVSDVLTLGVPGKNGQCVLIMPEREVELGARLY